MTEQLPAGEAKTSLWKYVGLFVAVSIGYSVLLALVEMIFHLNLSGVSVIVPVLSAIAARDKFYSDHVRLLEKPERWWLIWVSFGISVAWSAIFLGVMLATSNSEIKGGTLAVLSLIGAAITFLAVWSGYTIMAQRYLNNRIKYNERKAERAAAKAAKK